MWQNWPILKVDINSVGMPMYGPLNSVGEPSVPYRAEGYHSELCVEYTGLDGVNHRRLKPEWVVYDRNLFLADHATNGDDVNWGLYSIRNPYINPLSFSLYNTHTGTLRTFVFVTDPNLKQKILTTGKIVGNTSGNGKASALGLLENGLNAGIPLSLAGHANFKGWTSARTVNQQKNFWYMIDQQIPFDAWDANRTVSQESESIEYGLFAQSESIFKVTGEMVTTTNSSTPPTGLYDGEFRGVVAKVADIGLDYLSSDPGSKTDLQSLSFGLADDWGKWACNKDNGADCNGFDYLNLAFKGYQSNMGKFSKLPVNQWVNEGLSLAMGPRDIVSSFWLFGWSGCQTKSYLARITNQA